MIIKANFALRKLIIFSIAVLGLSFWTGNSMAQSEHDKPEMEHDKPEGDNPNGQGDIQAQEIQAPAIITTTKTPPPKKENHVGGEGKKTETAPSTLSFNIFLYIVDKFKAD
ncbi:hypothetical protein J2X69_000736 [Algoriphagus sp. 4150]|uniref:hypothetical protein n=1 Tax=Algoriphagus sp. 4150 TaxID=2817756 RepID=UPI00286366A7|nr:hypothetical protein [Algoriphagus sp. 4150]MDR7128404.1 hypothetical protein [Algoriphagus sp. 4150]